MNAADLIGEYMRVMDEAKEAARRSVLDGTVSCCTCRALVLEENADAHQVWHSETFTR